MTIYIVNIILIGNGDAEISGAKTFFQQHFVTKNLGQLRYFLGIEIVEMQKQLYYHRENMFLISYR